MAKAKAEEAKKPARKGVAPDAIADAAPTPKAPPRKARRGSGLDFGHVPMALREACETAVAEALAGLAKVSIEADEASFWEGAAGDLPLQQADGVVAIPVTATLGEDEIGGLVVMSRQLGTAVVNLMIGEAVDAPLESFDDLHRSVLAEATGGVVAALQEALSEVLPSLEMAAESAVEDDAARLGDELVASVSVELRSEEGAAGTMALVLPAAQLAEMLSRPTAAAPAAPSLPSSHFPQLKKDVHVPQGQNLGILLDVPMQMVAVLGRKGVKLRDLLAMGPGSIMELDKLAGEPLELLVNGKLIGYGEVIVLDEKFGIKVRDVVNPEDRLRSANL